jgi:hypothetical protein
MDILLLKNLLRIAIEAKGINNIDIFQNTSSIYADTFHLIQVSNFIYSSISSRMSAISI